MSIILYYTFLNYFWETISPQSEKKPSFELFRIELQCDVCVNAEDLAKLVLEEEEQ